MFFIYIYIKGVSWAITIIAVIIGIKKLTLVSLYSRKGLTLNAIYADWLDRPGIPEVWDVFLQHVFLMNEILYFYMMLLSLILKTKTKQTILYNLYWPQQDKENFTDAVSQKGYFIISELILLMWSRYWLCKERHNTCGCLLNICKKVCDATFIIKIMSPIRYK